MESTEELEKKEALLTDKVDNGITKVRVVRTYTHKGQICKAGHIWYEYSFVKNNIKYEGALQITTDWDEANDAIAYIKKAYIFKRETPLPKPGPPKLKKPKRNFDSRTRTQK